MAPEKVSEKERLLREELGRLRTAHRKLDAQIDELRKQEHINQIEMSRLKKKKLTLRDDITRIENQLLPDIIA